MNAPYLIGRRTDARDLPKNHVRVTDCRAGNGGKALPLAAGWAVTTFAAGAVLGWVVGRKRG